MPVIKPTSYLLPDPLVTISPLSTCSIGGMIPMVPNFGNAVYPTANLAILIPFRITRTVTAVSMFAFNGAAVSGNLDLGIFSASGVKLVSTGSTAQAGTNVIQSVDITDTVLSPGLYYMGVVLDNTTGTLTRNSYTNVATLKGMGLAEMASAFPLGDITFATVANAYVPMIGLTTRSVL